MNDLLSANHFVWGVYPYICLTLLFVTPFLRMIYRPFGLTTRASGIFAGQRILGIAAHLLHWGIFLAFFGHLAGLIGGLYGSGGWVAAFFWMGTLGGLAAISGSVIALTRRIRVPEMRAMSQPDDYIVHLFLIAIMGIAIYQALIHRIWGVSFTAAPWFASLWQFNPQTSLMDSAPLLTKIHIFLAFTFAAYFPFTKLIHAFTLPVNYFVRPYQVLRTTALKFQNRWEYRLVSDKSYMTYATVFAIGVLLLIANLPASPALDGLVNPARASAEAGTSETADLTAPSELTGYPLYVSQCARCHGLSGEGDGPGANSPTFGARPRNFVAGHFRYASTENGVASDADLRRAITRGLTGSGMPAFASLSERQVQSLVGVVGFLWRDRPEAGPRIPVPDRPAPTPEAIDAGKTLFAENCAACHGDKGRGDGELAGDIVDAFGTPVRPRNLAREPLRSGAEPEQIYLRIAAGVADGEESWIMPPFAAFGAQDIWALVAYLEAEILPRRPGSKVASK